MVRPSARTPILATHTKSSLSACILDAALSPQSRQCMRMSPKRPSEGVVTLGLLKHRSTAWRWRQRLLSPPTSYRCTLTSSTAASQLEAEFYTDSGDDSGNDPGDGSDVHSGDDGQLVSHLYPFMCQIDPRVSLVTPASPFLQ